MINIIRFTDFIFYFQAFLYFIRCLSYINTDLIDFMILLFILAGTFSQWWCSLTHKNVHLCHSLHWTSSCLLCLLLGWWEYWWKFNIALLIVDVLLITTNDEMIRFSRFVWISWCVLGCRMSTIEVKRWDLDRSISIACSSLQKSCTNWIRVWFHDRLDEFYIISLSQSSTNLLVFCSFGVIFHVTVHDRLILLAWRLADVDLSVCAWQFIGFIRLEHPWIPSQYSLQAYIHVLELLLFNGLL